MSLPVGNWLGTGEALVLLAVPSLATAGMVALFGVAVVAARRRGSRSYALLAGATGLLVVRSLIGIGIVLGAVPMVAHHLVEHLSDVPIAVVILTAAYVVTEDVDTTA